MVLKQYRGAMAMTLRLTDEETAALREYACLTGRSMHDVAHMAIHEYVVMRRGQLDEFLNRIVVEDAALLKRLAE